MADFLIRIEVEGPESAAREALEAALDGGELQEAINCYEHDDGGLLVTSTVVLCGAPGPRKLTAEDVEVVLTAEPEEEPVAGHFASDEPERDREMEREITSRLEAGDPWAWFCAKVEVRWNGFSGTDYLGCCSYSSEEDFRKGDYYGDMVAEALGELNRKVADAWSEIAPLVA